MLSYLSSWLWGDADDPKIILCKEVVLQESEDNGREWIWVDVESREGEAGKEEVLRNILQEYIVIPSRPIEKKSTIAPETTAVQKRSRRRDTYAMKKKRHCSKMKIYLPLQHHSPCRVRKGLKIRVGSKSGSRAPPYGCFDTETILTVNKSKEKGFPFYDIMNEFDSKCLEGFHFDGENVPWVDFHADSLKSESVCDPVEFMDCSTFAVTNTEVTSSDSWCEISDMINVSVDKVSSEGWSILSDSSGETLTSSMVRIWNIKKEFMEINQRPVGSLYQGNSIGFGSHDDLFALLDKPSVKRSSRKRKNRRRKNELTAKPGHTSLIVEKRTTNTPKINDHKTVNTSSHLQAAPPFSVSRGFNSLIHSSKDMLLALRVYLAQILDTVTLDNNTVQPKGHQPVKSCYDTAKSAQKVARRKNGRNTMVRWNASQMQRCDKAVHLRKRAMGKGAFNCSVKRSF